MRYTCSVDQALLGVPELLPDLESDPSSAYIPDVSVAVGQVIMLEIDAQELHCHLKVGYFLPVFPILDGIACMPPIKYPAFPPLTSNWFCLPFLIPCPLANPGANFRTEKRFDSYPILFPTVKRTRLARSKFVRRVVLGGGAALH
jgi:hypothetical protein